MWYDLSPMRPDEHANANARRWVEATTLRAAAQAGIQDAASEHEATEKLSAMRMQA